MTSPPSVCPNDQHRKRSCPIGSVLNCLIGPVSFFCKDCLKSFLSKASRRFLRFSVPKSQRSVSFPGVPQLVIGCLAGARPLCHRRWPSQAPDTSDGRKWRSGALPHRTPRRGGSLGHGGRGRMVPAKVRHCLGQFALLGSRWVGERA